MFVDGKDVALAQLEAGLALWYRKYARERLPSQRLAYEMAEAKSAADFIGLWQDRKPVPPWEWRNRKRCRG